MTPKERPIIFSAEMVRAILEGRKTQTRRPIKPQPPNAKDQQVWPNKDGGWSYWINDSVWQDIKCPYGRRGDRLWVRETWRVSSESNYYPIGKKRLWIEYKAGVKIGFRQCIDTFSVSDNEISKRAWGKYKAGTWRPPFHMPRWASRITLEITEVRVERAQDITEKDAIAEGAFEINDNLKQDAARAALAANKTTVGPIDYFRELWDSIYTKMKHQESDMGRFSVDSTRCLWDQNPWVWVICFSMLEKAP